MKNIKLFPTILLTVFALAAFTAPSASATTVPLFALQPFHASYLVYNLPEGTTFNGSISTTGDVRVVVNNPNNAQIVNLGVIYQATTFTFNATQNGNYTIYFENDLNEAVDISFSYVTNSPIPSTTSPFPISISELLTILSIVAIAVILILRFALRRSQTSSRSNPIAKTISMRLLRRFICFLSHEKAKTCAMNREH
jgi:hypothetical protein